MALYAVCDRTEPHIVRAIVNSDGNDLPDGSLCIAADPAPAIGLAWDGSAFGAYVPPPPSYPPSRIIAAIKSIDANKARAILANADDLDWAEFMSAREVKLDEPRLMMAIAAVGITTEALAAAISTL